VPEAWTLAIELPHAVFEVLVPVLQLIEASDFVDLLETFRRRYLRLEALNAGRQVLQPHRQSLI
jgi:hypothetical protein